MAGIAETSALLRKFFIARGFNEVETPLIIPAPVPEVHLDPVQHGAGYYRPSPEIEMKILLSEGAEKIFQIGSCFRGGEVGRLHRPCFTMLEWYETGRDYNDLLAFTKEMLIFLSEELTGSSRIGYNEVQIDISAPWEVITVHDAFIRFAGITPEEAVSERVFEKILVESVEPSLPLDRPVILKDYPAAFAALAKVREEPDMMHSEKVAERWELYLGGIEIANTYSELTDPHENRLRFMQFSEERKKLNKKAIPHNEDFFTALERGIPECSGCAMGVDRLTMILNNISHIEELSL